MPHYSYLLFDADNTLFDFDAANRNAFHTVCRQCDIPDTDETFALYERCNNAMWAAFDRGECTKDFLVVERFRRFLEAMALDRDPALCNRIHLTALGESTLLLSHAEEVCRTLSRTHRLYIVTNAVASVQRSRLHRSARGPLYHRRLHLRGCRGQQAQPSLLRLCFRPHPRYHTGELPAHR